MRLIISILFIAIASVCPFTRANAQTPPKTKSTAPAPAKVSGSPASTTATGSDATTPAPGAPSATRTDVYHIFFAKAALGKASQLADSLKAPNPQAPIPGHSLVLRHQDGDSWDYAVIQHMGTTATVTAARATPAPITRDLTDWHNDTYVSGPSWSEFAKAMGIDDSSDKTKTAGSVYVASVYRPAAGHRDQLEKMLGEPPAQGNTSVGNVLLQHLEGGAWTFLTVARYNSWQDFGTNESNSVTATSKNQGGWFQLREHVSYHTDTLTDRIFP